MLVGFYFIARHCDGALRDRSNLPEFLWDCFATLAMTFIFTLLLFSMNPNLNPSDENLSAVEKEIEKTLRPAGFSDFTGQEKVVENLKIFVSAAKQRSKNKRQRSQKGPLIQLLCLMQ